MNGLFDGIGDTLGGFFGAGAQPAQAPQTQETPAGATQVAAGPQPGLIEQWKNYLQDPSVRAGLMSMGTALLGGARPGESAGAFVGRSLQSGGAGAGAFQQQEEALRAAQEQERLKQAQIDEQGAARRYSADQALEGRMFTAEQNRLSRQEVARQRQLDRDATRSLALDQRKAAEDEKLKFAREKLAQDKFKDYQGKRAKIEDAELKLASDPLARRDKKSFDATMADLARRKQELQQAYGYAPAAPQGQPQVEPKDQSKLSQPSSKIDEKIFPTLFKHKDYSAYLTRSLGNARIQAEIEKQLTPAAVQLYRRWRKDQESKKRAQ